MTSSAESLIRAITLYCKKTNKNKSKISGWRLLFKSLSFTVNNYLKYILSFTYWSMSVCTKSKLAIPRILFCTSSHHGHPNKGQMFLPFATLA